MDRRLLLQALLESILQSGNVYFQPPENLQIQYPCLVYSRDALSSNFADNQPYRITKRYSITVIDRNPDSQIPDKIAELPASNFVRHYTADSLHHDVYTLYF